jgi:DNA-binding XRE family transcriptional regulator
VGNPPANRFSDIPSHELQRQLDEKRNRVESLEIQYPSLGDLAESFLYLYLHDVRPHYNEYAKIRTEADALEIELRLRGVSVPSIGDWKDMGPRERRRLGLEHACPEGVGGTADRNQASSEVEGEPQEVSSALRHRKRKRVKRRPPLSEKQIIGANLQKLRKEAGFNQRQVAEDVGFRQATVVDHESGRAGMRPATLKAYADYYSQKLGREITVGSLSTRNPTETASKP